MSESTAPMGLCAGTPVLTPAGPMPVEALVPGGLVLALSGVAAPFRPIIEVLHETIAAPLVRIRAGALADCAPQAELVLPAGTALLLDGALVAAGDLVDGHGILAEPPGPPVALVRLVLEGHDAVLAAGAAVETALPEPEAPPCAPRRPPDATLRALLAWRAEAMGWATPAPPADALPEIGSLRERLTASALAPPLPQALPLKPPR